MIEVVCFNPFTLWLVAGLISLVLMHFSPNRFEFYNDIHLIATDEKIDGVTVFIMLYIYLPISIPHVIKTYKNKKDNHGK